MKAKIQSMKYVAMVFIVCFCMASCSNIKSEYGMANSKEGTAISTSTETDNEKEFDYSIIGNNGEHFIVFDDITRYQDGMQVQIMATLEFPTIKAFMDTVTKGLLTDADKRLMASAFKKDEHGAIMSCDFDNLYEPSLPAMGSVKYVNWGGRYYDFGLKLNDGVFGWLRCLTESMYNIEYQERFLDLLNGNNKKVTVTKSENLDNNKEATYYSTSEGDFKCIRYSLSADGKTFIVNKHYRLRMRDPEIKTSSAVPDAINLYCTEGNKKYTIDLYNFTEDPTDDWLLSFGIKKYVDNGHIDK